MCTEYPVDRLVNESFFVSKRTCNGLAVFWPTMDLAEI